MYSVALPARPISSVDTAAWPGMDSGSTSAVFQDKAARAAFDSKGREWGEEAETREKGRSCVKLGMRGAHGKGSRKVARLKWTGQRGHQLHASATAFPVAAGGGDGFKTTLKHLDAISRK